MAGPYSFPDGVTNYDYVRYEAKRYQEKEDNNIIFYLPMPAELSDNLEATWAAQDNWLQKTKNLGSTLVDQASGELAQTVGTKTSAIVQAALKVFGGEGAIARSAERKLGAIVNPVSEQFFSGMNHRTFEFAHKLVAENEDETIDIKNIVNGMKSATTVSVSEKQKFLFKYPHIWDIRFVKAASVGGGSDSVNEYLPTLGQCAVTQIATNYSGAGAWARHHDGSPVEIDLTITLTELTVPTAGLFNGGKGLGWGMAKKDEIDPTPTEVGTFTPKTRNRHGFR